MVTDDLNREKLNKWVNGKLNTSSYSMRKLGGEIGVDPGHISRILSGKHNAGFEFYLKVAREFNAIPELLREAGLLPDLDEEGVTFAEIFNVIRQLSPEEQKEVLNYSDYLLKKQKGQASHDEGNVVGNHSATKI